MEPTFFTALYGDFPSQAIMYQETANFKMEPTFFTALYGDFPSQAWPHMLGVLQAGGPARKIGLGDIVWCHQLRG